MSKTVTLLGNIRTQQGRIDSFCRFVFERERIRIAKEAGKPRPWTKDPILQTYHFCNVRRADDRVTKWIGQWAKKNFGKHGYWFAFCVARWFNSPETLEQLTPCIWPYDVRSMKNVCKEIKKSGASIMRGSYIINSAYAPGRKKWDAVIDGPLAQLYIEPPDISSVENSLEMCHKLLMTYQGHGSFMAGQIVADWQTFDVVDGDDVNTWAPLGPGSNRGLKWIYAEEYRKRSYVQYMQSLLTHLAEKDSKLARTLTLHDVQNCLCEFSKYCRGYSKTKYEPYQESFL